MAGAALAFCLPLFLVIACMAWIGFRNMGDDDPEGQSVLHVVLLVSLVVAEASALIGSTIGFLVRFFRRPKIAPPDVF